MNTIYLADRMKNYENVTRNYLVCRTPVVIRLDGKAFHTFTRGFRKPFDPILTKTMQRTMKYLCENIEGCVLGYTQSDEITLILCDYRKLNTNAWFDNNIQKIVSVSASMATFAFNRCFADEFAEFANQLEVEDSQTFSRICKCYDTAIERGALFDSRVFNLPKEEVNNCLVWRQQDAVRNSIQAVAQFNFSEKQLYGNNCNRLREMLLEKDIIWEDFDTELKRGSCCIKQRKEVTDPYGQLVERSVWVLDKEIPIFSEDPTYVNDRITFDI